MASASSTDLMSPNGKQHSTLTPLIVLCLSPALDVQLQFAVNLDLPLEWPLAVLWRENLQWPPADPLGHDHHCGTD